MLSRLENQGGATNFASAIQTAMEAMFIRSRGDRPSASNVIVLITDGTDNVREQEALELAVAAKRRGITMVTVGVGSEVDVNYLRNLSSSTTQALFVPSFGDLTSKANVIVQASCTALACKYKL